jgi:hypothetical protein
LRGKIFAFRFPKNENQQFQVLWDQKQHFDFNQIHCPYPTQKLKRKKDGEVSHHPMRLAMERINQADSMHSQNIKHK